MKSLQLLLLATIGFSFAGLAQQKAAAKAVIKTPTVQCEKCKERIELYVAREYGVTAVKVNVKQKTTTVSWITDRTNIEGVKTAIANAGYDADDVLAEEAAYKKLPKCCKKPDATAAPVKKTKS
jgi:periplasmic mercuric ion binding protein